MGFFSSSSRVNVLFSPQSESMFNPIINVASPESSIGSEMTQGTESTPSLTDLSTDPSEISPSIAATIPIAPSGVANANNSPPTSNQGLSLADIMPFLGAGGGGTNVILPQTPGQVYAVINGIYLNVTFPRNDYTKIILYSVVGLAVLGGLYYLIKKKR